MEKKHLEIVRKFFIVKKRNGVQITLDYLVDFIFSNFPEYRSFSRDGIEKEVIECIQNC